VKILDESVPTYRKNFIEKFLNGNFLTGKISAGNFSDSKIPGEFVPNVQFSLLF